MMRVRHTSVKVGHRQAVTPEDPRRHQAPGVFALGRRFVVLEGS